MQNKVTFTKKNYIIILIGALLMALGYITMSGGGSEDPNVYNPDIMNWRRLVLSPIIILTGIVVVIFGIMRKYDLDEDDTDKNIEIVDNNDQFKKLKNTKSKKN